MGDPARAQAKPSTDGPRSFAHHSRGRHTLTAAYLYDGQLRPRAQLNAAGTVTAEFVYANAINVPDAILTGGKTYALLRDHLGSVRLVIDAQTGAVAQRLSYDAFGQVTEDTNPGFQPFGFAGGLYDADARLVHFGAREYDASIGRWISKDPSRFAGGANLYAYANGDPVDYADADGKNPFLVLAVLSVAATAIGIDLYGDTIRQRAQPIADKNFPNRKSGANNYLRHCVASCIANHELGSDALSLMNGREYLEDFFGAATEQCDVDRFNNAMGARAAESVITQPGPDTDRACEDECFKAYGAGVTNMGDR